VLGQGGFGITYKGSDTRFQRVVIIREFFPPYPRCMRQGNLVSIATPSITPAEFEELKECFLHEAKILLLVNHPGIPRVYDTFEENNTVYIVMEFLEGEPLSRLLEERGGVMEEAEAVGYILQAAEALEAVHQAGYLHRDIKPDNIFICFDGRVVLLDFALARPYKGTTRWCLYCGVKVSENERVCSRCRLLIRDGCIWLDPNWYEPLEKFAWGMHVGPPFDIYALGATLYHLLTGQVPRAAPDRLIRVQLIGTDLAPPHQLNPKVSRSVSEAVMKAMAIRVEERPQTVRAFIEALRGETG
jgi:serine/threonine protein kinase